MREFLREILKRSSSLSVGAFLLVLVALVSSSTASAAINQQINFQGKLTNPNGTNVTNGTYSIVFNIYTVASGGAAVWTETQSSVSVTDGIFRVSLGSVTSLSTVDFNGASLYLGITVGADSEMTPRVRFTSAPYAFNSDRLSGLTSTNFVQLGQSATPQSDASTNSSVFINKTATGNIVQLQSSGTDVFTVSNSGDLTLGQNGNKVINVAQEATNAVGNNLTITGGQGGPGAGANAGGLLVLQGGAGGGTNGNGGNLTLAAGAASGTGAVGAIIVRNPANSTSGFQIQNSTSAVMMLVDTSNSRVYVGDPTADANAVFLVLDTKNTAGDPAGVMGATYYNGALNVSRCFVNGFWRDCTTSPRTSFEYVNDVFSNTGDTHIAWAVTGGTNNTIASLPGHPGIITHSTGAAATNSARVVTTNVNSVRFGNNDLWYWQSVVRVNTVSDATQNFTYRNGFIDSGTAESTDGCFFRYNHAVNGGRWQGVCRNNNTESVCDTTIAMTAAAWIRLDVIVNAAGNSADFRTDGVSRCAVATNIPTAAGRETGFGSMILKSVGNTARTVDIDYFSARAEFTTAAR